MSQYIPYTYYYSANSLLLEYIKRSARMAEILPLHFRNEADYTTQMHRINEREYPRTALCAVLQAQNRRWQAGQATFANIAKLQNKNTFAIIAGQQVGLFTGPLYTMYKILTTLKLADQLSDRLKEEIVPVFWMATDDHDFAEINHIYIPDQRGEVQKLEISSALDRSRLPVSERIIPPEMSELLQKLRGCLPESEYLSGLFTLLERTYRQGFSYGEAFARFVQQLLPDHGLIVIDPSDPRIKKLSVPLFYREIEERSPVSRAVLTHTRLLQAGGFSAQLHLQEHRLNLFYHDPERRVISFNDERYWMKNTDRFFRKKELLRIIQEEPERFSPNAAMRLLQQDFLFPSLAIVFGPAEIAYFAQLSRAYQAMELPMPIAFPRVSLTLIEPRVGRLLQKFHLTVPEIFAHRNRVLDIILKKEIPAPLFHTLTQSKKTVAEAWEKFIKEIAAFDVNTAQSAEVASHKSLAQFDFVEKKILQAARKKDEVVRAQVSKLMNLLFPLGKPQERVFGPVGYVARFGEDVVAKIFNAMEVFNPDHQIVVLSGEE